MEWRRNPCSQMNNIMPTDRRCSAPPLMGQNRPNPLRASRERRAFPAPFMDISMRLARARGGRGTASRQKGKAVDAGQRVVTVEMVPVPPPQSEQGRLSNWHGDEDAQTRA
jgi:hypothetical protein